MKHTDYSEMVFHRPKSRMPADKAGLSNFGFEWTADEEVVLHGVVNMCRLVLGANSQWKLVSKCYHEVIAKLEKNQRKRLPLRSISALKKRYSNMHSLEESSRTVMKESWYVVYFQKWRSPKFNYNDHLLSEIDILTWNDEINN